MHRSWFWGVTLLASVGGCDASLGDPGAVPEGKVGATAQRACPVNGCPADTNLTPTVDCACTDPAVDCVDDNTDCDDGNETIHPGATEACNGADDDCVGGPDNGLAMQTYYRDGDGDGYGKASSGTKSACSLSAAGPGYVANNTDCDDTDKNIYPGAPEICGDGKDDNCNGIIDT